MTEPTRETTTTPTPLWPQGWSYDDTTGLVTVTGRRPRTRSTRTPWRP